MQPCTFLIAVLATMPADAGGVRSTVPNHIGRSVSHPGVAIFYRNSRNFPNSVSIFGRRSHTSTASVKKGNKRRNLRKSNSCVKKLSRSYHRSAKRKHAGKGDGMRGLEKRSKREDTKRTRSAGRSAALPSMLLRLSTKPSIGNLAMRKTADI